MEGHKHKIGSKPTDSSVIKISCKNTESNLMFLICGDMWVSKSGPGKVRLVFGSVEIWTYQTWPKFMIPAHPGLKFPTTSVVSCVWVRYRFWGDISAYHTKCRYTSILYVIFLAILRNFIITAVTLCAVMTPFGHGFLIKMLQTFPSFGKLHRV